MILTEEKQQEILQKYMNKNHTTDECSGFVDGINATIELINKLNSDDVSICVCGTGEHKENERRADNLTYCGKCDKPY